MRLEDVSVSVMRARLIKTRINTIGTNDFMLTTIYLSFLDSHLNIQSIFINSQMNVFSSEGLMLKVTASID